MKGMFGGKLPSNLPPPPTGLPTGETPPSDTITIVMGKDKTLGIGLNNDNIVTSVTPNSVAGRHGLRLGDVIVGWQGQPLLGRKLQDLLRPAPVHILSVCRGGVLFKPMAEAPAPAPAPAPAGKTVGRQFSFTRALSRRKAAEKERAAADRAAAEVADEAAAEELLAAGIEEVEEPSGVWEYAQHATRGDKARGGGGGGGGGGGSKQKGPPGANLFVVRKMRRGEYDEFNDNDLRNEFGKFGTVTRAEMTMDKETGWSKGVLRCTPPHLNRGCGRPASRHASRAPRCARMPRGQRWRSV